MGKTVGASRRKKIPAPAGSPHLHARHYRPYRASRQPAGGGVQRSLWSNDSEPLKTFPAISNHQDAKAPSDSLRLGGSSNLSEANGSTEQQDDHKSQEGQKFNKGQS